MSTRVIHKTPFFLASLRASVLGIGLAVIALGSSALGTSALAQSPAPTASAVADWPLSRFDVESSGAVPTTLPDTLDVVWEFTADEAIETTPVISEGRVFVADVMGQIYAINFSDGKEIWRHNYDTGFVVSLSVLPTAPGGALVVIGDVEGKLYAIDAATGKERWSQTTEGEINGSAAFYDDKVLATSQDGKLYAFAISDGKPMWTYQTDDQIRCSPTIAGSQTFLGGCDGRLHRVDLETGQAIGEPMSLGGPTGSTPAVAGSRAIVPIMDGAVLAFDWQKGTSLWSYEDPDQAQEYRGSAAVTDTVAIVTSRNKFVDAISLETGARVWRHTLRRRADASPVVAGKDVWIASTDGRLVRLALDSGEEKWQYEIRGSFAASPAIAHDRLVIADDKGVVRAFGSVSKSPTAPQPQ